MPSIVTANLLRSGDVVYLGPEERWVRAIGDALVAHDKVALAGLETSAARAAEAREVTAVYAMDVSLADGSPAPLSVRERIRAAHGPSIPY